MVNQNYSRAEVFALAYKLRSILNYYVPQSWTYQSFSGLSTEAVKDKMTPYGLHSTKRVFDGQIKASGVFALSESHAEMIQFMDPIFGNIAVDLMQSDPEHPMSQAFAANIDDKFKETGHEVVGFDEAELVEFEVDGTPMHCWVFSLVDDDEFPGLWVDYSYPLSKCRGEVLNRYADHCANNPDITEDEARQIMFDEIKSSAERLLNQLS